MQHPNVSIFRQGFPQHPHHAAVQLDRRHLGGTLGQGAGEHSQPRPHLQDGAALFHRRLGNFFHDVPILQKILPQLFERSQLIFFKQSGYDCGGIQFLHALSFFLRLSPMVSYFPRKEKWIFPSSQRGKAAADKRRRRFCTSRRIAFLRPGSFRTALRIFHRPAASRGILAYKNRPALRPGGIALHIYRKVVLEGDIFGPWAVWAPAAVSSYFRI